MESKQNQKLIIIITFNTYYQNQKSVKKLGWQPDKQHHVHKHGMQEQQMLSLSQDLDKTSARQIIHAHFLLTHRFISYIS